MSYYPVFLDVKDRRCVVCGGGSVALRKVEALLKAGAAVAVIAPEVGPELQGMADDKKVTITQREYLEGDLDGAFVVVAATDDREANRRIAADARKSRCLVNAVDDAGCSDFIVPSTVSRGALTIAVSTGGRSPALARKLRTRLETQYGEEFAELVSLAGDVRAELKQQGRGPSEEKWQRALDLDKLAALLREKRPTEARNFLMNNLTEGDLK
jgi:precorrin-2 dehydrogenase/sirohydrochlorin ferrochelatase